MLRRLSSSLPFLSHPPSHHIPVMTSSINSSTIFINAIHPQTLATLRRLISSLPIPSPSSSYYPFYSYHVCHQSLATPRMLSFSSSHPPVFLFLLFTLSHKLITPDSRNAKKALDGKIFGGRSMEIDYSMGRATKVVWVGGLGPPGQVTHTQTHPVNAP